MSLSQVLLVDYVLLIISEGLQVHVIANLFVLWVLQLKTEHSSMVYLIGLNCEVVERKGLM